MSHPTPSPSAAATPPKDVKVTLGVIIALIVGYAVFAVVYSFTSNPPGNINGLTIHTENCKWNPDTEQFTARVYAHATAARRGEAIITMRIDNGTDNLDTTTDDSPYVTEKRLIIDSDTDFYNDEFTLAVAVPAAAHASGYTQCTFDINGSRAEPWD